MTAGPACGNTLSVIAQLRTLLTQPSIACFIALHVGRGGYIAREIPYIQTAEERSTSEW